MGRERVIPFPLGNARSSRSPACQEGRSGQQPQSLQSGLQHDTWGRPGFCPCILDCCPCDLGIPALALMTFEVDNPAMGVSLALENVCQHPWDLPTRCQWHPGL